jgi:hypothetical protein
MWPPRGPLSRPFTLSEGCATARPVAQRRRGNRWERGSVEIEEVRQSTDRQGRRDTDNARIEEVRQSTDRFVERA